MFLELKNQEVEGVKGVKTTAKEVIEFFTLPLFTLYLIIILCCFFLCHDATAVDYHQDYGDDGQDKHADIRQFHATINNPPEERGCKVERTT